MGLNSLKFSKKKISTFKLLRLQFLNHNKVFAVCDFFVITANKNTGNSNFNFQLRKDDLLVIFYRRRHEFLYRSIMSQAEVTFYYFPTELVCYYQGLLQ